MLHSYRQSVFHPLSHISPRFYRKVEDLQFRVEEESITKGDLEVFLIINTYELCHTTTDVQWILCYDAL